eukprot:gene26585-51531_t
MALWGAFLGASNPAMETLWADSIPHGARSELNQLKTAV